MAYGPPDAPFHVIGSRTFPVPADRAMLTLLSELEKAGNTFSEYVANTEAYWRAIHRFRHPDWPDNARAKFEAEIERLRPIVERPPTLLLSIQSCMSDHGLSMLKNNDVLIANKDILAELRSLYREASDALNETPVQEPAAASPPPREDKQPAAVDASGDKMPEAPAAPIVLGKSGDEPIVRGKAKSRLTVPRYNVIKALFCAGDNGLTGDDLVTKSGHGGAVNVLKSLAKSDPDWGAVISLPGQPGGRYRIASESDGS